MVSRFTRSYQDAIHELNKSIKRLNYLPSSNPKLLREQSCGLSAVYCSAVGIHDQQLRDLHVIHVTGSKGKGSVCSMIESILRKSGFHTGFLSSPHLINVEERIRIDGQPISRDHFADVFWDVHGKLLEFTKISTNTTMPSFLHYIFVMACKAFVEMKPGSIAVVSHGQPYEATLKFIEEAEHVGCPLYVAPPLNLLLTKDNMTESIKKIIDNVNTLPKCQLLNLALSLTAVNFWFAKLYGTDDDNIQKIGLQPTFVWQPSSTVINDALSARWPGRWQIVIRRNITYFLDGAHTIESLQSAVKWFHDKSFSLQNNKRTMRIVIFTVTGPRDPKPFLECLQISSYLNRNYNLSITIHLDYSMLLTMPISCYFFLSYLRLYSISLFSPILMTINLALKSFPNKCTNNSDGADTMLYCHIFVTGSLYMVGRILKEIDEPV
ncbi:Folylpolyglutamate synthase, mitochondrial [Schistosoma japonicum]|nr:Folylpolyglutamate synthase, mitochondrial [Schistosoma japonicum]